MRVKRVYYIIYLICREAAGTPCLTKETNHAIRKDLTPLNFVEIKILNSRNRSIIMYILETLLILSLLTSLAIIFFIITKTKRNRLFLISVFLSYLLILVYSLYDLIFRDSEFKLLMVAASILILLTSFLAYINKTYECTHLSRKQRHA